MCMNKSPNILVSGRWHEIISSIKINEALSVTLLASSAIKRRMSHRICKIKIFLELYSLPLRVCVCCE